MQPITLAELETTWRSKWPQALELWSKYTQLSEPMLCLSSDAAIKEGLTESFAMIRLTDQAVVINLDDIVAQHLEKFPVEILGHEIGHHVFCPADLADQGRMLARIRLALADKKHRAPEVANLYADLLINDRLQRARQLDMAGVFKALVSDEGGRLWRFYMRIYEILWALARQTLAKGEINNVLEGDSQLGAKLIRSYSHDWLKGAGKFGALILPYLLEEGSENGKMTRAWHDLKNAGHGGEIPDGLSAMDDDELSGSMHPSLDKDLMDRDDYDPDEAALAEVPVTVGSNAPNTGGQTRQPFDYLEILKALGLTINPVDAAIKYYREMAAPHLVRYPERKFATGGDIYPEGLKPWQLGDSFESIDWLESVISSPRVFPGLTTVERLWGITDGGEQPRREPIDLDLYIDSSGSMPNPQQQLSYLALAGTIICLSALRVGAKVQCTLWSGTKQFVTTEGFTRDSRRLLSIITGCICGATAFPIHILRETYKNRKPTDRPVHIMVISDEGVDTMYDKDELGNLGRDISQMALAKARGGGTLLLNLGNIQLPRYPVISGMQKDGWNVFSVSSWEQLTAFARQFSKENYGEPAKVATISRPSEKP